MLEYAGINVKVIDSMTSRVHQQPFVHFEWSLYFEEIWGGAVITSYPRTEDSVILGVVIPNLVRTIFSTSSDDRVFRAVKSDAVARPTGIGLVVPLPDEVVTLSLLVEVPLIRLVLSEILRVAAGVREEYVEGQGRLRINRHSHTHL